MDDGGYFVGTSQSGHCPAGCVRVGVCEITKRFLETLQHDKKTPAPPPAPSLSPSPSPSPSPTTAQSTFIVFPSGGCILLWSGVHATHFGRTHGGLSVDRVNAHPSPSGPLSASNPARRPHVCVRQRLVWAVPLDAARAVLQRVLLQCYRQALIISRASWAECNTINPGRPLVCDGQCENLRIWPCSVADV
jgi:hypothetical protein